jgi:peroxiredoxin
VSPLPDRRPALASAARLGLLAGLVLLAAGDRRAVSAPGKRPADFSLRAVPGTSWRGTFRLSDHLGKRPVAISFFSTWCRPCELELPALGKLRARFPEPDLALVAVAVDGPESASQIAPAARRLGLAFPVVHDADSTVSARLNPRREIPFLILVDHQGRIAVERGGFSAEHLRSLPAEIEALVAARPAPARP